MLSIRLEVLEELIAKWEHEASGGVSDGSDTPQAALENAAMDGFRKGLRQASQDVAKLCNLLARPHLS